METNNTKRTTRIGHSVTCMECGLTYGDHRYLCSKDPNAAMFKMDRKFLGIFRGEAPPMSIVG